MLCLQLRRVSAPPRIRYRCTARRQRALTQWRDDIDVCKAITRGYFSRIVVAIRYGLGGQQRAGFLVYTGVHRTRVSTVCRLYVVLW